MELAKSLTELGYNVHVISRRVKKEDPKVEIVQGFTVHRVYRKILTQESGSRVFVGSNEPKQLGMKGSMYYLYLVTLFRVYVALVGLRVISKYKLNLIIERETSFGAGALTSILARKSMILEIIGPRYSRISSWRSKTIFYYTESMLRNWTDKRKCVAVPAGVNLSLFHFDEKAGKSRRESLGFEVEDFVIGYVGTFQDWHGIQDLLNALSHLSHKFPKLKALLVGPDYQRFQRLSNSLGLSKICNFAGAVRYNEVPLYINACDLMVALYNPNANPLRKKYGIGSPLKVLEYLACRKPVITTRVEPIIQLVTNNFNAILIEPGNSSELTEAIERLMRDPEQRSEMSVNGEDLVRSKYSWNSVASLMATYF